MNDETRNIRSSREVSKYKKFTQSLLGETSDLTAKNIDSKDYVKFLLKEGSLEEKREIMSCFKSRVILKEKKILLKTA